MKNNILDGLNKRQKAAVVHCSGPLRIIAGAGSGKTKVITHKIAYLIKHKKYDPSSIIAITFTNRAANEMISRVEKLIGDDTKKVQISTYHSLALKFLRHEINSIGYKKNFNVLDVVDQKQVLSHIYKCVGANARTLTYSNILDYISKCKMSFLLPIDMLEKARTDSDRLKVKIYEEYLKRQKTLQSLDFDDLLLYALKVLRKNKHIADKWVKKYCYILVDEFQDTSSVQYELIKFFVNKNITIVGDPDQTIYTWRGADVGLIINFNKDYKKVKTIKLEENYRSTKSILESANKLIRYNKKRLSKVLYTSNPMGEPLFYERLRSPDAEARWIVRKVKELQSQKIQLKNIAIFYRSNYLSKNIEQSLILENIEYKLFGSLRFYERQEIKDILAYLKIIVMNDDVAFNRMINVPARKIGDSARRKILELAQKNNTSIINTVLKNFKTLPLTKIAKENLKKFILIIKKHRIALATNKPSQVLLSLLKDVGYIEMWKKLNEQNKVQNCKEFVLGLKEWEEKHKNKTLSDYIEEVSLFVDSTQDSVGAVNSFISLMTIHSAKGLEFDYVFIMGMSEGVFPSSHALNDGVDRDEAIEEERRLAYVAITRARKMVYLVGSRGYLVDGKTNKSPSRFLRELGIKKAEKDYENYFVVDYELNYSKKRMNWVVGDKVSHVIFMNGIVVKVDDDTIDVKFGHPYNIKTLIKTHSSLKRR